MHRASAVSSRRPIVVLRYPMIALLAVFAAACGGSDARSITSPDGAIAAASSPTGARLITITATTAITDPFVVASVTRPFSATNTSVTTFTVTNTGTKVTSGLVVTISNTTPDGTSFSIAAGDDKCSTRSLGLTAKNNSCTVKVTFTPSALGTFTGTLTVTVAQPKSVTTVNLSGSGVNPQIRGETLVAGQFFACGLTSEGTAYCWGDNFFGQLGSSTNSGTDVANPVAMPVATTIKFASLAGSDYHVCGLTAQGAAYCWGLNAYGQLGTTTNSGTFNPNPTVAPVATGLTFASLKAGQFHTCALTADGTSYCWGSNQRGQLGSPANSGVDIANPAVTPVATTLKFASLTTGTSHTCGRTPNGAVYCWGYNAYGQLGTTTNIGTLAANPTVTAVPGAPEFASVTAGGFHTCGLTADGTAYCWGQNSAGQLGTSTGNGLSAVPTVTAVASALKFATLAGGKGHTCGIVADGTAYCWGANYYGQLGNADKFQVGGSTPTPTPVETGLKFARIAGGTFFSCGLVVDGSVACWGSNDNGQLGDGTTITGYAPVVVSGVTLQLP